MTLPASAMVVEPRHIVHALDAAQAKLNRQGWRNHSVWREGVDWKSICIHEAVASSVTAAPWQDGAIFALSKAVAPEGRGTSLELIQWNDRPGRTKADVDALIARVRKAHQ